MVKLFGNNAYFTFGRFAFYQDCILLFLFIGLPVILIIIVGNMNKCDEERRLEDEEEMKYIEKYKKDKEKRKFKLWR